MSRRTREASSRPERFRQDARIWEHKRWRDKPTLCDGDGPIVQLRAWYAQYFD